MIPLVQSAERRGILDVTTPEWQDWLTRHDEKPLRARQVRRWVLQAGAGAFADMTDLPLGLRQALAEDFVPLSTRIARHQESSDQTHKLLVELPDRRQVECVLIQDQGRRTACVSTQVGCGMGCVFCASGLNGVERNLSTAEILEQLLHLRRLPPGGRLSHIVVMGMGEPLANLERLLEALEIAIHKDGLGIGARHITISTVGLPLKIRQLADLGKQYHLAVSLHAPNDELRTRIVPTNDQTGLDEILAAADYFYEKTGRQVTYEYVLLGGLNDRADHARAVAHRLARRQAHVNLIPWNDVEGLPYQMPAPSDVTAFAEILRRSGISVKVRKRKGSQIDAACGQLRRSAQDAASSSAAAPPSGVNE